MDCGLPACLHPSTCTMICGEKIPSLLRRRFSLVVRKRYTLCRWYTFSTPERHLYCCCFSTKSCIFPNITRENSRVSIMAMDYCMRWQCRRSHSQQTERRQYLDYPAANLSKLLVAPGFGKSHKPPCLLGFCGSLRPTERKATLPPTYPTKQLDYLPKGNYCIFKNSTAASGIAGSGQRPPFLVPNHSPQLFGGFSLEPRGAGCAAVVHHHNVQPRALKRGQEGPRPKTQRKLYPTAVSVRSCRQ